MKLLRLAVPSEEGGCGVEGKGDEAGGSLGGGGAFVGRAGKLRPRKGGCHCGRVEGRVEPFGIKGRCGRGRDRGAGGAAGDLSHRLDKDSTHEVFGIRPPRRGDILALGQ